MKRTIPEIQLHETSADFPFRIMTVEKNVGLNYWHSETEIIQALDTNMNVWVNDMEYCLRHGDILLITSGDIHRIEKPDRLHLVIQFDLTMFERGKIGPHFVSNLRKKLEHLTPCSHNWPETSKNAIKSIIEQLTCADKKRQADYTGYLLNIQSLLYQLINIFWNDIPERDDSASNKMLFDKKMLYKLEKVMVYIKNNYSEPMTLESVSRVANYSVNHFTKIWYRYIGTHFHTYLTDYRVNEASALLRNTNLSIAEIATKCGFNSYKTFSRVFKSINGVSATEYRTKH